MLNLTDLFAETALILACEKTKADASERAVELAEVLENEVFKYKDAHMDAMYLVQRMNFCRMKSIKQDLGAIFDKHHDLFAAVLQKLHTDIMEDFENLTVEFIENIENGVINTNDHYGIRTDLIKSRAVCFACEQVLFAYYEVETHKAIPF